MASEGSAQHSLAQQWGNSSQVKSVATRSPEDEEPRGTSVEKHSPPPPVVLTSELEVQQRDGDEGCYDHQHDKGQIQDAEQRVDLMPPMVRAK